MRDWSQPPKMTEDERQRFNGPGGGLGYAQGRADMWERVRPVVEAAEEIIADWDVTGAPRPGTWTHPLRIALNNLRGTTDEHQNR